MNGKWVVDYNTFGLLSNQNFRKEFDTEEEAIAWGKEINRKHEFEINGKVYTLSYLHLVYEPEFTEGNEDDAKVDAPAQEGE